MPARPCPAHALAPVGWPIRLAQGYVSQRLQQYDAAYCAQAFDLLVHAIGRLQAPARRDETQQAYAKVAELFAAASAAEADTAAAKGAAPAGSEAVSDSVRSKVELASAQVARAPAAHSMSDQPVQLLLEQGLGGRVAVRLSPLPARVVPVPGFEHAALPASAAGSAAEADRVQLQLQLRGTGDSVAVVLTPSAAAVPAHSQRGGSGNTQPERAGSNQAVRAGEPLRWELRLVPSQRGDGSVAAVMVPVAGPRTPDAAEPLAAAGHRRAGSDCAATGPGGGAVGEASITAVVAAARFMHRQLNQLKADVAAAHLALLKGARPGGLPSPAVARLHARSSVRRGSPIAQVLPADPQGRQQRVHPQVHCARWQRTSGQPLGAAAAVLCTP